MAISNYFTRGTAGEHSSIYPKRVPYLLEYGPQMLCLFEGSVYYYYYPLKLPELTSFHFVYIRAAVLINNLSQLRRLFK